MQFLAPLLGCFALLQMGIAVVCFRQFPRTRLPAGILFVVAPVPFVAAIFGESLLATLHTPSSLDPNADWLDLLFQLAAFIVLATAVPGVLCAWIATCIHRSRARN